MKIKPPGRQPRWRWPGIFAALVCGAPLLPAKDISPAVFDPISGNLAGTIWLAGQLQKEADQAEQMIFFTALLENDSTAFTTLLSNGQDPNAELPFPPPRDFSKKVRDELLGFYVAKEPGLTALMMATALGNTAFVKALLADGAAPYKMTHHYKTYALWLAGRYHNVEIMQTLLQLAPDSEALRLHILVDLAKQKATLSRDGQVELETNISSGRESHPTPVGMFVITDKYPVWKSSLYHEAPMPLFLRLSCGDFGLHSGSLPGYPVSHGCIHVAPKVEQTLFDRVPIGTVVEIR